MDHFGRKLTFQKNTHHGISSAEDWATLYAESQLGGGPVAHLGQWSWEPPVWVSDPGRLLVGFSADS
jgi:hypothetical protein